MVVLPQPDSPTSASVSPARHVEVEAVDGLDRADLALEQSPCVTGKCFCRPVTREQRAALGMAAAGSAGSRASVWDGVASQPRRHLLVRGSGAAPAAVRWQATWWPGPTSRERGTLGLG